MTDRRCSHCGDPLPAAARSHAKYCGKSCRVMASRARKNAPPGAPELSATRPKVGTTATIDTPDGPERVTVLGSKKLPAGEVNVEFPSRRVETVDVDRLEAIDSPELPAALTRRSRWVRRSAAKCPLDTAGSPASASDESTWTTYANAAESTAGAGMGFVLNGDGIICVDIDHCITDGVLGAEAEAFLASLPATYIEISPSGDGLHIWGRGMVLTSRKFRNGGMQGEVIGSRKYATVTGNRFRNSPLTLANVAAQAGPLIY